MDPADRPEVSEVTAAAEAVAEARRIVAAGNARLAAAAVRHARSPQQLGRYLLRLVVRLEPAAFAARHRQALADRGVTVVQGVDGIGYVTGQMTAADAAAIDATLTAAARSLGTDDPRSQQQRRADLFTDLLLGRLLFTDRGPGDGESADDAPPAEASESRDPATDLPDPDSDPDDSDPPADEGTGPAAGGWLEIEDIDPDTGELLGTHWQRLDPDGHPDGGPIGEPTGSRQDQWFPAFQRRPQTIRIGVVVPLTSLLGLDDSPGELTDRSAMVPAETIRQLITDTLDADRDSRDQILFSRLLTDDGGRLLDVTEVGRFPSKRLAQAVRLRAGTCTFPTCTVPADQCDIDHHEPVPRGPTAGPNLDPGCRRHHRGKTFAWLASVRNDHGVDWTMPDADHYRCADEPLPLGRVAAPGVSQGA